MKLDTNVQKLAGLTVLHLDKDFDLIAEITAQPMERLNMDSAAEMGSDTGQAEALSLLGVLAVASGAGGARTHDRRIMSPLL